MKQTKTGHQLKRRSFDDPCGGLVITGAKWLRLEPLKCLSLWGHRWLPVVKMGVIPFRNFSPCWKYGLAIHGVCLTLASHWATSMVVDWPLLVQLEAVTGVFLFEQLNVFTWGVSSSCLSRMQQHESLRMERKPRRTFYAYSHHGRLGELVCMRKITMCIRWFGNPYKLQSTSCCQ